MPLISTFTGPSCETTCSCRLSRLPVALIFSASALASTSTFRPENLNAPSLSSKSSGCNSRVPCCAVITQADVALERRDALGHGKPFFRRRAFFQLVVAGGHYRQHLQGFQARPWQRAVFDVVDDQKLDLVVVRQILALDVHAVMRGTGEQVTIQRHQFNAHGGIGARE